MGQTHEKRAEASAFADIIDVACAGASQYATIYNDYEQRNSLEARLVKAADVLDLLIQAYALERAGARGLDEFWEVAANADFQLPSGAAEVVNETLHSILAARNKLH